MTKLNNYRFIIVILLFGLSTNSFANKQNIPRFVTIKSNEVNARSGPNLNSEIKWVYQKKSFPVEVIEEFEQWRKIKDFKGDEGWIHSSVLSPKRSVVVISKQALNMYKYSTKNSKIKAIIHPEVVCNLKSCNYEFCKVICSEKKGWIERKFLWGVYPNEDF